jgi:plastocyanin
MLKRPGFLQGLFVRKRFKSIREEFVMRTYLSWRPGRLRLLWVGLVIAAVATVLLAACGGGGGAATTATPTATTAQPTTQPTTAPTPTTAATTTTTASNTVKVQIVENNNVYSFSPAAISITKGTQIVWTNTSDAPHTVTSDTGAFNASKTLMQNDTFTMTFTTAGTFSYHCSIHTYMKAAITVTG